MRMKVISGNKQFRIPVPLSMASFVVRGMSKKYISKDEKRMILLTIKICKKELKQYKGLDIVEINSSSGERIIITV